MTAKELNFDDYLALDDEDDDVVYCSDCGTAYNWNLVDECPECGSMNVASSEDLLDDDIRYETGLMDDIEEFDYLLDVMSRGSAVVVQTF